MAALRTARSAPKRNCVRICISSLPVTKYQRLTMTLSLTMQWLAKEVKPPVHSCCAAPDRSRGSHLASSLPVAGPRQALECGRFRPGAHHAVLLDELRPAPR